LVLTLVYVVRSNPCWECYLIRFQGVWKCVGSKGTIFSEAELVEGEWNDYDEKVNLSNILYFAKLMLLVRLLFRSESLTSTVGGIEHEDF
jgi:hypothetical protein